MYAWIPREKPLASTKHLKAVGILTLPERLPASGGRRYKICPVRHRILVEDRQILIESWNNQGEISFLLQFLRRTVTSQHNIDCKFLLRTVMASVTAFLMNHGTL